MKKNKRVGIIMKELLDHPCKQFDSKHFCDRFDIAKSSLSEDMKMINEILAESGSGCIESTVGVGGGIKYVPGISKEDIRQVQAELKEALEDESRVLGGGYLYTSDVLFNGQLIHNMARIFADKFYSFGANSVVTVETKGIPLAAEVAFLLNLPLVVIRREARFSEGSTVSINYFSGSGDRIQKMSLAKRAVEPGTKAIIIDDFMRGGGSMKGIVEILDEFDVEVVGMGVAIAATKPEKKRVTDYVPVVYLDNDPADENKTIITPNEEL